MITVSQEIIFENIDSHNRPAYAISSDRVAIARAPPSSINVNALRNLSRQAGENRLKPGHRTVARRSPARPFPIYEMGSRNVADVVDLLPICCRLSCWWTTMLPMLPIFQRAMQFVAKGLPGEAQNRWRGWSTRSHITLAPRIILLDTDRLTIESNGTRTENREPTNSISTVNLLHFFYTGM